MPGKLEEAGVECVVAGSVGLMKGWVDFTATDGGE